MIKCIGTFICLKFIYMNVVGFIVCILWLIAHKIDIW